MCHSTSVATASSRVRWAEKVSGKLLISTLLVTVLIGDGCTTGMGTGNNSSYSGGTGVQTTPPPPPPPPPAPNVLPLMVSAGIGSSPSLNRPYVSVTVCLPGTAKCQTVNNVLLDSGSTGLRIFSSVLNLPPTLQQEPPFGTVYECFPFESFNAWGPVATADVQLSGETASSVGIQLIGDSTYTPPPECSNGKSIITSPQTAGLNGILGVSGRNDCGNTCFSTPYYYYYWVCSSMNGPVPSCQPTLSETIGQQVWNPVALFPTDNNGVIFEVPGIPATGARNVQGSLYFGIGTEANNQLGSATQYQFPLTAKFDGGTFAGGVDSGTAYIGFLSDSLVGLPMVGAYYSPADPTTFTVEMIGANGEGVTVDLAVADPTSVLDQGLTADYALMGQGYNNSVVLGFPFFYGRKVFYNYGSQNASTGPAPYVAF